MRDRGLYASLNEGIAATTGDWIYISTAGDPITREQLCHLLAVGEELRADVVVSPPTFIHEDGSPHRDLGWPPAKLLAHFGQGRPFVMQPEATQYLAFRYCPQAILGSSAANLYRGTHLRARPFPTEYSVAGDTGWIMRYGHETRLALTPRQGSSFCIHPKEAPLGPAQFVNLTENLLQGETRRLRQHPGQLLGLLKTVADDNQFPQKTRLLLDTRRSLWHAPTHLWLNKTRWLITTFHYLWSRGRLQLQRRQQLQRLLALTSLFEHFID